MKQWQAVFDSLSLNRKEKQLSAQFLKDGSGLLFLSAAKILLAHQCESEGLEILTTGLKKYPNYLVARVALAEELFNKGYMQRSWDLLKESPSSLAKNTLAQKIQFRLAFLLGFEAFSRSLYDGMKYRDQLDISSQKLGELLESEGFEKTRKYLQEELRKEGIAALDIKSSQHSSLASPFCFKDEDGTETLIALDPSHIKFVALDTADVFDTAIVAANSALQNGQEIDDLSMAEVFEKSEQYERALSIYKNLLRKSPQNERLRMKLKNCTDLLKEQKQGELNMDKALLGKIESIDAIDRQMDFINELMRSL